MATGLWWWLAMTTAVGLTAGSFLNVVIYRLPLGLSVFRPLRSFCPHCEAAIAWYDNLPVLSFALRGGRCRHCGGAISLQYPVVELLTALLFVLVFDTFFVAQVREGLGGSGWLGDRLWAHWPVLVAHLVLVAGLLAVSGTDIQAYWLDVRITWLVAIVGIVMFAVWTPVGSVASAGGQWWRPGEIVAGACLTVAGVRLLTWLVYDRPLGPTQEEAEHEAADQPENTDVGAGTSSESAAVEISENRKKSQGLPRPVAAILGWVWVAVAVAVPVWVWWDRQTPGSTPGFLIRSIGILLGCFVALVLASLVQRETDDEIEEVIEDERVTARRVAGGELLRVLPALVAGAAAAYVLVAFPAAGAWWGRVLNWAPAGSWKPLTGLALPVVGFVLAGGFAWAVRVFFTLLLGKEALGFGDVHILAAAGAVAGPAVAVLAFFGGAVLALAGLAVLLPFKRSRVIPFGPWLALGVVIFVVAYPAAADYFGPAVEAVRLMTEPWLGSPGGAG